ncbi:MAG: succinate dehydrogenase cytochrome b subunit [Planctomycetota bacterium]|nr:succinate dehydrogenase cytochrome b subunit [Planctomycetota bacterium]
MRGYSALESGGLTRLLSSSIGTKFLMALTGVALFGFLLGHLGGNLLVFAGRDAMNAYAHWLHTTPFLVWGTRLVLLPMFLLHIYMAVRLTGENRSARPEPYRYQATVQAPLASRYMMLTGALVAAYVVYHLLHFTFNTVETSGMGRTDAEGRADVYAMVVGGFQSVPVALSYIVANVILGVHLWHGLRSMLQTLGWTHPVFQSVAKPLANALPALIAGGYVSIPLAVWTGVIS